MSKAFTRENDDLEEVGPSLRATPSGDAPNYLTPEGEEHLRKELATLGTLRRKLQSAEDGESQTVVLKKLTARIQMVSEKLANAEILDLAGEQTDEVRFGVCVTIRHRDGTEDEYRIVGVNEVDLEEDRISWLSPLAKALLGKKVGTVVHFQAPSGEKTLEIIRIRLPDRSQAK